MFLKGIFLEARINIKRRKGPKEYSSVKRDEMKTK
jgi:hypothetical protein